MFRCIPLLGGGRRRVESVDGRHGSLSTIPDHVLRQSASLRELLLDVNRISELPRGLFRLTKLFRLSLSDNEINYLPPDIANLINLEELDVSKNDITEIPENIKFLNSLNVADFSGNPLSKLPSSFPQLSNLSILGLNDVSLSELPHDIGSLSNLTSLELRQNFLKELPASFSQLHKLERLDLGSNEFEELQPLIGQLSNLQELWLDCNELFTLPPEIHLLKKLNCLDVSENRLEAIPEEIGGLESLTDLHLSQNCLELLPDSIGRLQKLTIFKVDQNRLGLLNQTIGNNGNLQELILTENLLSELPSSIGNLTRLTNLNADRNRLLGLPLQIGNLTKLGVLSLRDNCLSYLPEEMGNLTDLKVLDVSGNRLHYLPITITALNLKAIWLAENQAQPMLKFQTDVDEKRGCKILTCFLLPQQACHVQSMENLVYNNTEKVNRLSWDLKSDKEKIATVKFVEESDDEEKETQFIRHDTPHPKELKARHNKLFVQKGKNIDGHILIHDNEKNDKWDMFRPQRSSITSENEDFADNLNSSLQSNDDTEILCSFNMEEHLPVETVIGKEHLAFHYETVTGENQTPQEFLKVNGKSMVQASHYEAAERLKTSENYIEIKNEEEQDTLSSINKAKLDHLNENNTIHDKCIDEDKTVEQSELATQKYEIVIETIHTTLIREQNGLGFSIAGGQGSLPYKEDSENIYISRIADNGAAFKNNKLKVGDRVISINGIDMEGARHDQAVALLTNSERYIQLVVEREQLRPRSSNIIEKSPTSIIRRFSSSPFSTNFHSSSSDMANRLSYLGTYRKLMQKSVVDENSVSAELSNFDKKPFTEHKTDDVCEKTVTPNLLQTEKLPIEHSNSVPGEEIVCKSRPLKTLSSAITDARENTSTSTEKDIQQPDNV